MRDTFDAAYYERFYLDPRTRAETAADARRRADFIVAYLRYLDVRPRRVADVGCGLGHCLRRIARLLPAARCVGVERSEWLCERYGWTLGSVVDFRAERPFDLVICNDVVQYLDDAGAARALDNLAGLTRVALFFGVLTREDWEGIADPTRTDDRVYRRRAAWYRRRLARHFVNAGGGLYVKRDAGVVFWSLEHL